jgi:hypothetical protein
VAGPALPRDGVHPVVMVLVESVARVWVQRKEDKAKVGRMMAALAGMTARLAPVRRPAVGCDYGAWITEDDVMYRANIEIVMIISQKYKKKYKTDEGERKEWLTDWTEGSRGRKSSARVGRWLREAVAQC